MKDYQVMPELTAEEYAELKADIAERGVMVPIEFDQHDNVLDGHHRLRACQELGITTYPRVTRVMDDEVEKLRHAWQLNTGRRNLTAEQRNDAIVKMKTDHPELSDRQIAYITGASHSTVIDALKEPFATGQIDQLQKTTGMDGRERPATAEKAQEQREAIRDMIVENPDMNNHQIAQAIGASDHTVAKQRDVVNKIVSVFNPSKRDADALKDPDIQRRLAENEGMNVAGAIREQRRDQLVERLDSVEAREAKAIEGVYDVIVIDPPWPMARIETDRFPHAVKMDYPVMSLDEIKNIKIPAADDCHVFLWTTQKYLRTAFDVLEAWDVRHVWTFVWVKNDGMKPFQLPKSSIEFILYGHIGNPKFVNEDKFWSHIQAPITHHSEKPEAFYEMIRHVTAGRRLDMFNRRSIDGFETWGKEAD